MWKDVRHWGGWVQLIRKLGVNWDLRAERRRQPEGAREVLAAEGTEVTGGCANTRGALCAMAERGGRGSCQGLWLENVHRRAGNSQSHTQQYRIAWKYLLNKGWEARETPASCIHHLPSPG